MNRGKVASFIVSLFFCVDSVNYPSKNTKPGYARKPQHTEQAWSLLYFTPTRKFKYSNTLKKSFFISSCKREKKLNQEEDLSRSYLISAKSC